jgi:16S rRNA (uracil1498-N3)-methyltransferase
MHRFFIPPNWLHGSSVILRDPVAHQIRAVLRMRPGARIIVLDNRGWEYEVELVEVRNEQSKGTVKEKRPATGEPGARITLYQCLLKKDNFEWVLQKGTEIGVARFVPVISQRTVIPDLESVRGSKLSRWERIITEAAEQSRRGLLPVLDEPLAFADAVSESDSYHLALIPWEQEEARHIRGALAAFRAADRPAAEPEIALFIGPEGGFTDDEIAQAVQEGALPVTLGRRILRAETAAVTAALLTLYELGE